MVGLIGEKVRVSKGGLGLLMSFKDLGRAIKYSHIPNLKRHIDFHNTCMAPLLCSLQVQLAPNMGYGKSDMGHTLS